ncbi:MAG: ribonuclease J [Parvibaculales bacterium]
MTDENLVFVPLGGTGEIGMNLNLYGFGAAGERDWIMVDCGVTFGDERDPGIDVIMPDTRFIEQHKKRLHGLVLTHGHEDHIGAVAYLWPRLRCPIYATPFTAELVMGKLKEAGLEQEAPLHILDLDGHIDLGPFSIDLIGLTHSIAEPFALAIRTPLGNLLHTGDWKIDTNPLIGKVTDSAKLVAFGEEGIDAIICDSTNVLSPGVSGSESDVAEGLAETIAECTGRVVVTTFASNVARLEAIGRAARRTGRHLTLVGRGMHRIYNAARKTGYLQDFPKLLSDEDAGYLPPDKLLILCTGSQGEPRAALSRIASGTHPHLVLEAEDTVIFSSKMIPGNETGILDLQNRLAGLGVTILTSGDRTLHVSGHPNRDELVQMYDWVRPKCAVPVHGEHRHLLAHAALAEELGVETAIRAKNGDMVKLLPGQAEIVDVVTHGRLHMDGDVYVAAAESPSIQRRKLAYNGLVSVSIAVDKGGRLAASPEVQTMGLPDDDGLGVKLEDWLLDAVDRAVPENGKITPERAEADIKLSVRREMRRRWGKKPEVLVNFCYV